MQGSQVRPLAKGTQVLQCVPSCPILKAALTSNVLTWQGGGLQSNTAKLQSGKSALAVVAVVGFSRPLHFALKGIVSLQATIMTDPNTADRTYIGPMTPELVEQIIANVSSCHLLPSCTFRPLPYQCGLKLTLLFLSEYLSLVRAVLCLLY